MNSKKVTLIFERCDIIIYIYYSIGNVVFFVTVLTLIFDSMCVTVAM